LMELEREHPGIKNSMLKALANVAPRHLLDTRLNPPAELRATLDGGGDTPGAARAKPSVIALSLQPPHPA
jgi:hypothetical protein